MLRETDWRFAARRALSHATRREAALWERMQAVRAEHGTLSPEYRDALIAWRDVQWASREMTYTAHRPERAAPIAV